VREPILSPILEREHMSKPLVETTLDKREKFVITY
jgi:hypothetical protein